MQISYKISKVYKLVDSITNNIITNADIIVDKTNYKPINKKNGFYLLCNLPKGKYEVLFICKGYKPFKIDLELNSDNISSPEIILMELEENTQNMQDKFILTGKLAKAKKPFYYNIARKGTLYRLSEISEKGQDLLKMNFAENISLEFRKIIIGDTSEIYTIQRYDFINKGYILDKPLEQDTQIGDMVYLLNNAVTDKKGNYTIVTRKDFKDRNNKYNLIFILGTKVIKKEFEV